MGIWLLLIALLAPVSTASQLPLTGVPSVQVELYELTPTPTPPVVKARAAIVLDLDSGKTLFALDAHGRFPPASLTKVMTALVALDTLRLDQVLTVPASINQLPWDSTRMGLRAGERLTVRELMYGLFLNSGNDAAITLSEAAMPRAAFVARMNARAAALAMGDSHFVNPIGLDDAGLYASAADLAKAAIALTLPRSRGDGRRARDDATGRRYSPCLQALQPQRLDPKVSRRDRTQDRLDRKGRRLPDRHGDPRRPASAGGSDGLSACLR